MTSRLIGILSCLFLLLPSGAAHADRLLTLDDAIALARQNNRDLKAARVQIDLARVGVEQARQALLPTATLQGRYTRNSLEAKLDLAQGTTVFQPYNQLDATASLSVPILTPWAYPARAAATENVEREKSSYDTTEATLLYQVAISFYAAAGADELLQARQNAIVLTGKTLDNAKAKVAAGLVNRVEVARAEIAVVQAQEALGEAENVRADTYQSLGTLLQLQPPFRVTAGPQEVSDLAPAEQLARDALNMRPEVSAYRHDIQVSALQAQAAKLRLLPALSGFGMFHTFNYAGFYSQANYVWALGLSLDWTVYDGGARDVSRHTAELQVRQSQLKLAALGDVIGDEISRARRAVETKRVALAAAERVVGLAADTLDIVRAQHETGTISQLELLTAQDAVVKAATGVAAARFELALASVGLRRAAGMFPGK